MKLNSTIEALKQKALLYKDEPNPRNALEDLKEQIWQHLKGKKFSRKMFFIKSSGIPLEDLLNIKKWAESTDDFSRAYYGAIKKYHLTNRK